MEIKVLREETINQIAAGEVIERPLNIVKELVENAIDAGASSVSVEIRDGGLSLIRVTDNGCGIGSGEVRTAFLRHATSKLSDVRDLERIRTLGFRGEALASIAAVARVELISKTPGVLMAVRYQIAGGAEEGLEEIGAPDGTTVIVRELFYNVPARKKFLKSSQSEGARIQEILEKEALAHPELSFRFLQDGRMKLQTLGNGSLMDVIFSVYGREAAQQMIPVNYASLQSPTGRSGVRVRGFLGKPVMNRSSRNFEIYFVNARFVRDPVIQKAIEDGCRPFLMQHKFPFTVLMVDVDPEIVDVNVHPQKLEVRFSDGLAIYNAVMEAVRKALRETELVADVPVPEKSPGPAGRPSDAPASAIAAGVGKGVADPAREPAAFSMQHTYTDRANIDDANTDHANLDSANAASFPTGSANADSADIELADGDSVDIDPAHTAHAYTLPAEGGLSEARPSYNAGHQPMFPDPASGSDAAAASPAHIEPYEKERARDAFSRQPSFESAYRAAQQESLFEEPFLSEAARTNQRIIGQLFDTYWLVEYGDKLYIIDQHAAHEKVNFERMMKRRREQGAVSQYLEPPIVLSLSPAESGILEKFESYFTEFGYLFSHLGGQEYSLSAVPADLPDIGKRELFLEMLDSLHEDGGIVTPETVYDRIATMSCKAAVKGGQRMDAREMDALLDELLSLDNPYACPHGRPTIIAMSKYELEKKFKRVV